jgi:hypothetical protein
LDRPEVRDHPRSHAVDADDRRQDRRMVLEIMADTAADRRVRLLSTHMLAQN